MKFLLLLSLILIFSCSQNSNDGIQPASEANQEQTLGIAPENDQCICTKEFRPVCGSNGQTYGNPCMAECEGVKEYTQGEC